MKRPTLIIIQGAPAAGKTTLLQKLEAELNLPSIGKDDIKEFLFERLKQSDRDFSRAQGRASIAMLLVFVKTMLQDGRSVIAEAAFYSELARPEIVKILEETDARCLEIFCHANEDIRIQRFNSRAEDGSRHPGHLDTVVANSIDPNTYSVLSIGEVVDVDTTSNISDTQYTDIVTTVRHYLTERE